MAFILRKFQMTFFYFARFNLQQVSVLSFVDCFLNFVAMLGNEKKLKLRNFYLT
jgi:hypothetical protein